MRRVKCRLQVCGWLRGEEAREVVGDEEQRWQMGFHSRQLENICYHSGAFKRTLKYIAYALHSASLTQHPTRPDV